MNVVDIGEKIGHICFSMRGKSISLVGQAGFVGWLAGQLVSHLSSLAG
jgi:hypothetical protein